MTHKLQILGSNVPAADLSDCVDDIERCMCGGTVECQQFVNTGFHGIWEGAKNPEFRRVLNEAHGWVPDGIAVSLIARAKGAKGVRRIGGPEFMKEVLRRGRKRGYRHYFFGEKPDTLEALQRYVEQEFAGNKVVGTCSPPFRPPTEEDDEEQIQAINEAQPDILWVALGLPKQERWIYQRKHRLEVPVAVGVGAVFGFLAGTIKRAPPLAQRLGLEWAYRVLQEPRKCWRRSLLDGPQFLSAVLLEHLGARKYDEESLDDNRESSPTRQNDK